MASLANNCSQYGSNMVRRGASLGDPPNNLLLQQLAAQAAQDDSDSTVTYDAADEEEPIGDEYKFTEISHPLQVTKTK